VRKLADELLTKYPTMFSTNFEANKKALEKVAVIRNRALRNQIAGAISSMVSEHSPGAKQEIEEAGAELEDLLATNNSPAQAEENTAATTEVSQQAQ
jgi:small subunit ribosomal protein S17e